MPDLVRIRVCEQIKSALENLGAAVAIICEQYSDEALVQETGKKVIQLVLELQELADGLEDVGRRAAGRVVNAEHVQKKRA